jgi:hypothetical protein
MFFSFYFSHFYAEFISVSIFYHKDTKVQSVDYYAMLQDI